MIILINGSINSGKTSVSKALVKLIPNTAHVEVDSLREFVEWMPLEESIPLNLANAVSVTRNFCIRGLNVVLSYPLSEEDFAFLEQSLSDIGTNIHRITLCPPLAVALSKRGARELDAWEIARIRSQYSDRIHAPSSGLLFDNSGETPEQTALAIAQKIGVSVCAS